MKYLFIIPCCFFILTNACFAQIYTQDEVIETTYIGTIKGNTPVTGIFVLKDFTDKNGISINAEYTVKNGIKDGEFTETRIIMQIDEESEDPESEPTETTIIEKGTFSNGKKVEPRTETRKTADSEVTYVNNIKNGPFTIIYGEPFDEIHKGIFVDGKIEGTLLRYVDVDWDDGKPGLRLFGEVTYVNGQMSGPFILYNVSNGTKYITGTFDKDMPHGELLFYTGTGSFVGKALYDNGTLNKITCFDAEEIRSVFYEEYYFDTAFPEPIDSICEEGTFKG